MPVMPEQHCRVFLHPELVEQLALIRDVFLSSDAEGRDRFFAFVEAQRIACPAAPLAPPTIELHILGSAPALPSKHAVDVFVDGALAAAFFDPEPLWDRVARNGSPTHTHVEVREGS